MPQTSMNLKEVDVLSVGNKSLLEILKSWIPPWETPGPGHPSAVSQHLQRSHLDFPQDSESISFLPFFFFFCGLKGFLDCQQTLTNACH